MERNYEKKRPELGETQTDESDVKQARHQVPSEGVGVTVAPVLVGLDKGGSVAQLPLRPRSSLEEVVRLIVREEMRAVLREELSGLVAPPPSAPPSTPLKAVVSGDEYLPTKEAARVAGVRPETIRIWVTSKRLPAHWAGTRLRIRRDQLESFLSSGGGEQHAVDMEVRARDILDGRFKRKGGR